jgi:hypothetical protein
VRLVTVLLACSAIAAQASQKMDGYRGIWYYNQPSGDQYVYKYSGGLGTYTEKHVPLAVYSKEADKTFFVYGGSSDGPKPHLILMAGCYDHKTGMVPKPTVVMERNDATIDAHYNPVMFLDKRGYVWVFAPSHGGSNSYIFRSTEPYSVDNFEKVVQKTFSYPHVWYFDDFGWMLMFTKYTAGRELYVSTSQDGITWTPDVKYAGFGGHYQVTATFGHKRGAAFNWHPPKIGLNGRTNLYYVETDDFGKTFHNVQGKQLTLPLSEVQNDAMVREYHAEGLLVYEKDLAFDKDGHPVIFYLLSKGYQSGPENAPYTWMTARWTGSEWVCNKVTDCDHNYDSGCLMIEKNGTWRIIGPSDPGPQKWATGGEMVMWTSKDQGLTWTRTATLTSGSKYNHSYSRRPINAKPDFYSFWADGDAFKRSESHLYFTDRAGDKVWVLPYKMTKDFEKPAIAYVSGKPRQFKPESDQGVTR